MAALASELPVEAMGAALGTAWDALTEERAGELPDEPEVSTAALDDQRYGDLYYRVEWDDSITITGCEKNVTSITVPVMIGMKKVTAIGSYAFRECTQLKSLAIPEGVESLGSCMIEGTGISSIVIPKTVTNSAGSIYNGALAGCKTLNEVIFAQGIEKIPAYICSSDDHTSYINIVYIPKTVQEIENRAFYECDKLQDIYFEGSKAQWEALTIGSNNDVLSTANIHYNFIWDFPEEKPNIIIEFEAEKYDAVVGETITIRARSYSGIANMDFGFVPLKYPGSDPDSALELGEMSVSSMGILSFVSLPITLKKAGDYEIQLSVDEGAATATCIIHVTDKNKPEPTTSLVFGIDTYDFENTYNHFFTDYKNNPDYKKRGYKISDEYAAILLVANALGGTPIHYADSALLVKRMYSEWKGSCFGMSAVLALTYADKLDPSFFQPNRDGGAPTENLFQLNRPVNDPRIFDLINYYQLAQDTPATLSGTLVRQVSTSKMRHESIVNGMNSTKNPLLISFSY